MQLTVHEFRKRLDEEVRAVCSEFSLDFDKEHDRGVAFQVWTARLFCEYNPVIDTDPEDGILKSRDLGVDCVLEAPDNQQLFLIQCKFTGTSRGAKTKAAPEDEVLAFATLHERLQDRAWLRANATAAALDLLGDYADRVNSGWHAAFAFVTTGSMTDRTEQSAKKQIEAYRRTDEPVSLDLLDFEGLKAFYIRTKSIEEDIPDGIEVDLPRDNFFVKATPRPTLIAAVKGTWVRQLYDRYKESLFSWNIRGYMGNRGLNSDIAVTAEEQATDFFYYNNGISAICKSFEIDGNHLKISKLQVINGAQTIGSIAKAAPRDELAILFRLTETDDVNIEKGINSQIIRYNNTQNVIKVSDFRSNDSIQKWLEREFKEARNLESMAAVSYLRKRGKHVGAAKALRLEELAKYLYCYYYSPLRVYSSPRDLWTLVGYGGVYEFIFGEDGKQVESWSGERFQECLLCLAVAQKLEDVARQEKKLGRVFIHRLRFHLLSLLGLAVRGRQPQVSRVSVLKNKEKFGEVWDWAWPEAKRTLTQDYVTFCEEGEMTLHAYMRSEPRWRAVSKIFVRNLDLPESVTSAEPRADGS